jgi:protein-disulfide isomerase-like protein with CxxC motif
MSMTHCDLTTGECGPLSQPETETVDFKADERVKVLFATDPICSHCWAMEPAWRKLLFHYGHLTDVQHLYGGLVKGWEGFEDAEAGIRQPADVAPHWEEVAEQYGQPISGDVWRNDPLASSYPPSIAVHTVRLLAPEKEDSFLRRIRQAVFLEAHNIARTDVLVACAVAVGLDANTFSALYHANVGQAGFERDLSQVRALPVAGFPTLIFVDRNNKARIVRGTQPFAVLEATLLDSVSAPKAAQTPSVAEALAHYQTGTTKEFAELLNLSSAETKAALATAGAEYVTLANSELWRNPVVEGVR